MKMILQEGGAGGHMAHPFDLPTTNTGKDLLMFFNKSIESIKHVPPSLKVDGVNATIKLTNKNGRLEFALDRGSLKPLDVMGVTINDLQERFGEGHGLIAIGNKVLTIFNNALPSIKQTLQKMGMLNNYNYLLNLEYIDKHTNVIQYDKSCIVLHGLKHSEIIQGARNKPQRIITDLPYSEYINELAEKMNQFSSPYGFDVFSRIYVKFTKRPDFSTVLNTPFTFNIDGKQKDSRPLKDWVNIIKNPRDEAFMLYGAKTQYIAKKLYVFVLEGKQLIDLSRDVQTQQNIKNGVLMLHLTRMLGNEVLKCLTSPIGDVAAHEGIVINDPTIASVPVKITGEFIINGMQSKFQQPNVVKESVDDVRVIACYPGRFQPFHTGHHKIYKQLESMFTNVLILTSDAAIDETHPFSFAEKELIATKLYGIPKNRMRVVKNPYLAQEVLQNMDPSKVKLIMALGEKDAQRFNFKPKKDGSPSYYQPFKSIEECVTAERHGYIKVLPNIVYGANQIPKELEKYFPDAIISATSIRNVFKTAPLDQLFKIFEFIFGKFDKQIFDLFYNKFRK